LDRGNVLAAAVERGNVGEGARLPTDLELSPPARCAALTALLDLGERALGIGAGETPAPVPCNATLAAGEPAAGAEQALSWAAEGYETFKLKLGTGDDVAQVQAVREALGDGAQIRIDANASWDLETAREILSALEPLGVQLAEQPVVTMERAA